MPVNPFALTDGVPEARVGERLALARRRAGMGRWRAAHAARVPRSNLVRFERGRVRPPDGTVIALCRTYGVAVSWLVPERTGNEVVVGDGRIEVAGRARAVAASAGGDPAAQAVLGSYLAIVRELRGVGAGGVVSLRDEDLVALARALGDTPSEIEARLVDLMKLSRDEARAVRRQLLTRRVAVPAAGLLLATATVTGALDGAGGGGGAVDGAGARTFDGVRTERTVDEPGAGAVGPAAGGAGAAGAAGAGGAGGAVPSALAATDPGPGAAGSPAAPHVAVDTGADVVIGDAVSLVRDTPAPPAPRVVIPLPPVPREPVAGDTPTAPGDAGTGGGGSDGSADENAGGGNDGTPAEAADAGNASGGDSTGAGGATGGTVAAAHGANPDAGPGDAGGTGNPGSSGADGTGADGTGADGTGADGNGNARGGNERASGNAADGAGNGGPGNERAGAASPASNGNGGGASNAGAHA